MELSKNFTPKDIEAPLYEKWEAAGCFQPPKEGEGSGKTFTVMIPPPNVTGVLHMGHALNGTIQDIVVRHRRMAGFDTLWVPGTDHAGIATQAVVEKKIYAEEKKTREDLGREEFLKRIWDWKEHHGNMILRQFRSLGCSCDWTRTKFTMDEDLSLAVRTSFVELWERELIYRGARLVNWDCVLETAVSDDEIEKVSQKGKLWHLKYPLSDDPGTFLTVATTRPETMLGDTGVAVHPEDERYKSLVGKTVRLPFVDRDIPIVADDSVDPAYGSGAVKITPGHDPADYERGQRHSLPIISLLEKDGTFNGHGGPFAGKKREVVRRELVAQMDEMGLLGEVEGIVHNVPLSDRSKSAIEPIVSEQWFVKMEPLAAPAIEALKSGELKFRPERWGKVYLHWLENVHDWCISRQLWWGHRIPVWYDEDDAPIASVKDLAIGDPHPKTGKPIVRQDPDVLDTWASSWLWPMATLGWPNNEAPDLARFYPTQFLSTAQEIIYLWVARMVMAGYAFMPERPKDERNPFSTCYIHATVLDGKGKRMSKSAGNGIDPLDLIEQFGADAVRFSLVLLTKEGQDVRLAPDRMEQGSRFCNKVWNAARFVMMNMEGEASTAPSTRFEDRWILSRLARVTASVSAALDEYRFNDAASEMYRFVWNDFCDWYVELSKARLTGDDEASAMDARATLTRVLKDSLGLLHPFTPYITEQLWEALHDTIGAAPDKMLCVTDWPTTEGLKIDDAAEAEMTSLQDLIGCVRRVRALTMTPERKRLPVVVAPTRGDVRTILETHAETAKSLGYLESLTIESGAERPAGSAVAVAGGMEAFVVLSENVDFEKLKVVLAGRAEKVGKALMQTEKKLENKGFLAKADPELIDAERERLVELSTEKELLERNLAGL